MSVALSTIAKPSADGSKSQLLFRSLFLPLQVRFVQAFIITFVVLYLRRPDVLNYAQFWCEDGKIFFLQQLALGFPQAAATPYAGYLLIIPRLIAGLAALFPIVAAPYIYSFFCLAIASICYSAFTLSNFRYLIRSDALRFAVCLLWAAVIDSRELLGVLANIQWNLFLGALLLAVAQYSPVHANRKKLRILLLSLTGFLITLTAPLCAILVPILLWRSFRNVGIEKLWPILMIVGIVIEFFLAIRSHQLPASTVLPPLERLVGAIITSIVYRVFLVTTAGASAALHASGAHLTGWISVALVVIVVWLTALHQAVNRSRKLIFWTCIYLLVASVGLPLAARCLYGFFDPLVDSLPRGERYFFVGACIYIFLLAFTFDTAAMFRNTSLQIFCLVCIVTSGLAQNFRIDPMPNFHWPEEAGQIENWLAMSHKAGRPGLLILHPPAIAGWGLIFPCRTNKLTTISGLEGCLVSSDAPIPQRPIYIVEQGKKRHLTNIAWIINQPEIDINRDLKLLPQSMIDAIPVANPVF
jgi:hypothetical protein